MGYRGICPVPMNSNYSKSRLLGQDSSQSRSLQEILKSFGIGPGAQVGCCYSKYFADESALDIRAYLANILHGGCG